jgi:uncharacterized membrane protein YgaE (UPF0421/DUF939 family)
MVPPSLPRATGLTTHARRLVRHASGRSLLRHPRIALAVRASVAATIAWLLAQRVPGGGEFAFYAPFGAVVTTYSAVVRSTVETLRTLAAILLGAAVGLAADQLVPWSVVAVAGAVGVGVLVAGLPFLGDSRTYVPVAAIFLLLLGQGREVSYAASYAGLFLLGALVTIVLDVAFPTVPVTQARRTLHELREEAAVHLRHMAGLLRDDDVGPAPQRSRLTSRLGRARDAVDDAVEAARGNVLARRRHDTVARIGDDFAALERVVMLVDDLHDLSADEPWGTRVSGVAPDLRRPMASAVTALADAVTTVGLADTEPGRRRAVDDALRDLGTALLRHERDAGPDAQLLVVATVVTTLRRTLSALTPADRIGLSTTPWQQDPVRGHG